MVPNPNGKGHFCIEFRYLNECSMMEDGLLPRIKELLHRIGERRANYFAVMDLTSGYQQTAIDEDSQKYIAFVTSTGVFEGRRVPMGLKGHPRTSNVRWHKPSWQGSSVMVRSYMLPIALCTGRQKRSSCLTLKHYFRDARNLILPQIRRNASSGKNTHISLLGRSRPILYILDV